jgi:hypothetical protein
VEESSQLTHHGYQSCTDQKSTVYIAGKEPKVDEVPMNARSQWDGKRENEGKSVQFSSNS